MIENPFVPAQQQRTTTTATKKQETAEHPNPQPYLFFLFPLQHPMPFAPPPSPRLIQAEASSGETEPHVVCLAWFPALLPPPPPTYHPSSPQQKSKHLQAAHLLDRTDVATLRPSSLNAASRSPPPPPPPHAGEPATSFWAFLDLHTIVQWEEEWSEGPVLEIFFLTALEWEEGTRRKMPHENCQPFYHQSILYRTPCTPLIERACVSTPTCSTLNTHPPPPPTQKQQNKTKTNYKTKLVCLYILKK